MRRHYVVLFGKIRYKVSCVDTRWKITRPDRSHLTYTKATPTTRLPAFGEHIVISSTGDTETTVAAALNGYSAVSADYIDELRFVHDIIVRDWERGGYQVQTAVRTPSRIGYFQSLTENMDLTDQANIVVGDSVCVLERASFWYALVPRRTKMKRIVSALMDKGLEST